MQIFDIRYGRASAKQYSAYWAFCILLYIISVFIDQAVGFPFLQGLVSIIFFGYGMLAMIMKRIRDIGYDGRYGYAVFGLLIFGAFFGYVDTVLSLFALPAIFALLAMFVWGGTPGPNDYGDEPQGWVPE